MAELTEDFEGAIEDIHFIAIGKSGERLAENLENSIVSTRPGVIMERMSVYDENRILQLTKQDDRLVVIYGDDVSLTCRNLINATGYNWPGKEYGLVYPAIAIYGMLHGDFIPVDKRDLSMLCYENKLKECRVKVGSTDDLIYKIKNETHDAASADATGGIIFVKGDYSIGDYEAVINAVEDSIDRNINIIATMDNNALSDDLERSALVAWMLF